MSSIQSNRSSIRIVTNSDDFDLPITWEVINQERAKEFIKKLVFRCHYPNCEEPPRLMDKTGDGWWWCALHDPNNNDQSLKQALGKFRNQP